MKKMLYMLVRQYDTEKQRCFENIKAARKKITIEKTLADFANGKYSSDWSVWETDEETGLPTNILNEKLGIVYFIKEVEDGQLPW